MFDPLLSPSLAMAEEYKWNINSVPFRGALNARLRVIKQQLLHEISGGPTAFCVLMCVRSCLPASVF